MRKPITNMGKWWEIRHSLWMIWLFIPFGFTTYISFFIIGSKAKEWRWQISGFIYVVLVIPFFLFIDLVPDDHILSDISVAILLGQWIAAWVQATKVRPIYLKKMAMKENPELAKSEDSVTEEIKPKTFKPIPKYKAGHQPEKSAQAIATPKVLNINKASQDEIASLPDFNNVLAKRVIDVRRKVGSFESMPHLIEALNIKPHIIAKAKPYITFEDQNRIHLESKQEDKDAAYKRKYTTGRVVDY